MAKITFLVTCAKYGKHLTDTLASINLARGTGRDVEVKILTQLPGEMFASIPSLMKGLAIDIVSVPDRTGILDRFDFFLRNNNNYNPDDIFIFTNDDIIFDEKFIEHLRQTKLIEGVIGPIIYKPDGSLQTSMFRKHFSFWSLIFRIYDGGLYSRIFQPSGELTVSLNCRRQTVDGCCFILSENSVRYFNREFNFVAFLYMEEVIFQFFKERYGLNSFVDTNLKVVHLGGATLSHRWSWRKSLNQIDSVTAVARSYLGLSTFAISILKLYYYFEAVIRLVLGSFRK